LTSFRDPVHRADGSLARPYYAATRNIRVSARVSDAIALALRLGIPIHAENTVLDAAADACTAFRAEGDDRTPD
jgi:bifunctional DNase/RNase